MTNEEKKQYIRFKEVLDRLEPHLNVLVLSDYKGAISDNVLNKFDDIHQTTLKLQNKITEICGL